MDDRLLNLMGKLQHLENEILQEIQLKENDFFCKIHKKRCVLNKKQRKRTGT